MKILRQAGKAIFQSLGYEVSQIRPQDKDFLSDFSTQERKIIAAAKPFTMTSVARMAALLHAINYLVDRKIQGNIVECGVFRGGSMMVAAGALLARNDTSRSLYLYDTFEGMSEPSAEDKFRSGETAKSMLAATPKGTGVWCEAGLEAVRANLLSTGYPSSQIHFITGKVEDTIPATLPGNLALLRLDTDWYSSTKHELEHLFPLLVPGGVLIVDDYGDWQGARKAVDEYFADKGNVFLHRIDDTGRLLVH